MEKVPVIKPTQPFQCLVFCRAILFLETSSMFLNSPVAVIKELVFDKLQPIRLALDKSSS